VCVCVCVGACVLESKSTFNVSFGLICPVLEQLHLSENKKCHFNHFKSPWHFKIVKFCTNISRMILSSITLTKNDSYHNTMHNDIQHNQSEQNDILHNGNQ